MSTPGTDQPSAPLSNLAGISTWFFLLVFVLVFYILSPGPLLWLLSHGFISESFVDALEFIYIPLQLLDDTPVGRPLDKYFEWCAS